MADHNLKKAQKSYRQVICGDIPDNAVASEIDTIYHKLRHSQRLEHDVKPSLVPLDPETDVSTIEQNLATATDLAQRSIAVKIATRIMDEMYFSKQTEYEPPHPHVLYEFTVIGSLANSGADMDIFKDDRRPSIKELSQALRGAEERLKQDKEAFKQANQSSRSR